MPGDLSPDGVSARGMARHPALADAVGQCGSCPWGERADQSRNIAVLVLELVPHPSLLSPMCSTNPGDSHGQKRKQITVNGLGRNLRHDGTANHGLVLVLSASDGSCRSAVSSC